MRVKLSKRAIGTLLLLSATYAYVLQFLPVHSNFDTEYSSNLEQIHKICRIDVSDKNFEQATVSSVIDGDTIMIRNNNSESIVRLIGINAPEVRHSVTGETQYYGEEASQFATWLLHNKTVLLERDKTDTDAYNRLLRYVYLPDGTMVNCVFALLGYAHELKIVPDTKHNPIISAAISHAKREQSGVWSR